jgi:hypothetical protein
MATKKKAAKKKVAKKKTVARKAPTRADLGAPIDGFFAKQPEHLRAILESLRALVEKAAPKSVSALKWGMPFYELNGQMLCALTAHRAHVNLLMVGPTKDFIDPDKRLSGNGKVSRQLKLTQVDQIPRAQVRKWLAVAVKYANRA